MIPELKELYAECKTEVEKDFFDVLRLPSISTDQGHDEATLKTCEWVANYLRESGLEVEVWETPRLPVVFATWLGAGANTPTVLMYNHYDVQPVDPLDEWESDPFEPVVKDGEVYARGAQDNKGQMIYCLAAVRALMRRDGKLPVNLKFIVEGEEESKSVGLEKILPARKEQLKADVVLVADLDMANPTTPAVTLGMRGMIAINVELKGADGDLHSGMHGGIVYNPLHAMVEMLAKLRDERGRITVPGFYDDVAPLSDYERSQLSIEIDEDAYQETFGALTNGGERDFSAGERNKIRPTLEINGIHGGYGGPGTKTVIPARVEAKLTSRLVKGQDPQKILASLKSYLHELCPEGMEMNITDFGAEPALRTAADVPVVAKVKEAHTEVFGNTCELRLSGGSIPIISKLGQAASADVVGLGLGLLDDNIHAPNEHFGLDRLELGFITMIRILQRIGQ